jgi:hypothetical protein
VEAAEVDDDEAEVVVVDDDDEEEEEEVEDFSNLCMLSLKLNSDTG